MTKIKVTCRNCRHVVEFEVSNKIAELIKELYNETSDDFKFLLEFQWEQE